MVVASMARRCDFLHSVSLAQFSMDFRLVRGAAIRRERKLERIANRPPADKPEPGQRGASPEYLLARLQREQPGVADELAAGLHANLWAAAVHCGLLAAVWSAPTDPDALRKALAVRYPGAFETAPRIDPSA